MFCQNVGEGKFCSSATRSAMLLKGKQSGLVGYCRAVNPEDRGWSQGDDSWRSTVDAARLADVMDQQHRRRSANSSATFSGL